MGSITKWGQGIGGLAVLVLPVASNAAPPSISSTGATQILQSFGLRVAACNPDWRCMGGTAATGQIDTFTIDGKFQTSLYRDDFGDWKHTPVLRPECEQVRTSYQMTGQPAVAAQESICDYTVPR